MIQIVGLMIGIYVNASMLQGMFKTGETQDKIGVRIVFSLTAIINAFLIAALIAAPGID